MARNAVRCGHAEVSCGPRDEMQYVRMGDDDAFGRSGRARRKQKVSGILGSAVGIDSLRRLRREIVPGEGDLEARILRPARFEPSNSDGIPEAFFRRQGFQQMSGGAYSEDASRLGHVDD